MLTVFLVLAAMSHLEERAPTVVAGFALPADCALAAAKANQVAAEVLNTPAARELGLRFICLRMEMDA